MLTFVPTAFDLFNHTAIIFAYALLTVSILKSVEAALGMVLCVSTAAKALGKKCNFSAAQGVVLVTLRRTCRSLWVCFSVPMSPALQTRLKSQFPSAPYAAGSACFPPPQEERPLLPHLQQPPA